MAEAVPRLLTVDDEVVAIEDGAGPERGEVGAGIGFRHALAPDLVAAEERPEAARLLLVGAEDHDRGRDVGHADGVDGPGRFGSRHLLVVRQLLEQSGVATPVLPRATRWRRRPRRGGGVQSRRMANASSSSLPKPRSAAHADLRGQVLVEPRSSSRRYASALSTSTSACDSPIGNDLCRLRGRRRRLDMEERTFVDAHGVEVFTRWWPVDDARGPRAHLPRRVRALRPLRPLRPGARTTPASPPCARPSRPRADRRRRPAPGVMGPGGGEAVIDDLHELRRGRRAAVGGDVPVFLFGHSMGSLIALAYLTRHADGLAGSVLCGFPANVDDAAALGALLQGFADAGMRDEPVDDLLGDNNAAFEPARTPFDWLSRDPDEVDRYVADPMCGDDNPLTYGYLIDLFDVVAPGRRARWRRSRARCSSSPATRIPPRRWAPTPPRWPTRSRERRRRRRPHALRGRPPRAAQRDQPRRGHRRHRRLARVAALIVDVIE